MFTPATTRCSCGVPLHSYATAQLNNGHRRDFFIAQISGPAAWAPMHLDAHDGHTHFAGVWAASADDLLLFGNADGAEHHQHDVQFYTRDATGAVKCRVEPGTCALSLASAAASYPIAVAAAPATV